MASPAIQQERLKEVEKAFQLFDKNSDGKISKDELRMVLDSSKIACSEETFEKFFTAVDRDCNGYIDYNEFCTMVKNLVASPQQLEAKMKTVFKAIDEDNDKKISHNELRRALAKLGHKVSEAHALEIVNTFDRDKDGYINFEEFVTMMLVIQQCPMGQ